MSKTLRARTTIPSRLDRYLERRRSRLLRCHHDRHKYGRLVRPQRQLVAPRRLAPGKEMLRADLMPAGHLRHDRPRRKQFRDDPPLVRVTPPSPATNATANLDAPSRRGSVNYMVDHICEPMPSTGSHLPNYAARCKVGERHRSDVRSQGPGRTRPSASTSGSKRDDRAQVGAEPEGRR